MPRNCPRIALFSFFFRLPWMSIFRPIHPRPLALHSCFLHWIVPSPIARFPFPPRRCFVPLSLGSPHASRSFLPRTSIRHTKLGQGFGRFCLRHGEVRTAEDGQPRGIRSTTVHSSLASLSPSHSLTLPQGHGAGRPFLPGEIPGRPEHRPGGVRVRTRERIGTEGGYNRKLLAVRRGVWGRRVPPGLRDQREGGRGDVERQRPTRHEQGVHHHGLEITGKNPGGDAEPHVGVE